MPAWRDPSDWLLNAVAAFKQSGGSARALHLEDGQLAALLQFVDTGPNTTGFADFHKKLHTADTPNHRPRPPIPAQRLRTALKTLRAHYRVRSGAYRLMEHPLAPGNLTATPYSLDPNGHLSQYRCGYVGVPRSQIAGRTRAYQVKAPRANTNVLGVPAPTLGAARKLRNYPYLGRAPDPRRNGKSVNLYRGSC